jgi:hypothetical protein
MQIFWFLFILAFLTLLLQVFTSSETNLRVIMARKRAFEGRPRRWWHRLDWYGPVELRHANGHRDISIGEAVLQPWKVRVVLDPGIFDSDLVCDPVCLHFPYHWSPLPLLGICVRTSLPAPNDTDYCLRLNIRLEHRSLWPLLHWTWYRLHAGSCYNWQHQRPHHGKTQETEQQYPYSRGQTEGLRLLLVFDPAVLLVVRLVRRTPHILARPGNRASMLRSGNDRHFPSHSNIHDRRFPRKRSNSHRRISFLKKCDWCFSASSWPNSLLVYFTSRD